MKKGKVIAAMGIPASGKSTVMKKLHELIPNSMLFLEAEEEGKEISWPRAVNMRDKYGYFGSLSWFRALRVPKLIDAEETSNYGKISIIDSYYDKLMHHYLGKRGLDWFYPKEDPYFNLAAELAKMDYELLPMADIIVFLWVSEDIWTSFYSQRNREMDNEILFRKQCMDLQEPMLDACKKYINDYGKKLIVVKQEGQSVRKIADYVYSQIEADIYETIR